MTDIVHVPLGDRAYDVHVGQGLFAQAGDLIAPLLGRPRVFVVSERRVAGLHLDRLQNGLGDIEAPALLLEPGEATKGWAGLTQVVEWLLDQKCERGDVVVALGGGVIGDLVGFAAAILRRGVRFVQVPTSLLAQVDSSTRIFSNGWRTTRPVWRTTPHCGCRPCVIRCR